MCVSVGSAYAAAVCADCRCRQDGEGASDDVEQVSAAKLQQLQSEHDTMKQQLSESDAERAAMKQQQTELNQIMQQMQTDIPEQDSDDKSSALQSTPQSAVDCRSPIVLIKELQQERQAVRQQLDEANAENNENIELMQEQEGELCMLQQQLDATEEQLARLPVDANKEQLLLGWHPSIDLEQARSQAVETKREHQKELTAVVINAY